jgi:hypothetical protein
VHALGSDGKATALDAHKKDGFVTNSPRKETALGYEVGGDAGGEVRAWRVLRMVTHGVILLERNTSRYAFTARRGR